MPVSKIRAKVRATRQKRHIPSVRKSFLNDVPADTIEEKRARMMDSRASVYPARYHDLFAAESSDDGVNKYCRSEYGNRSGSGETIEVVPALQLLLSRDVERLPPNTLPMELVAVASFRVNEAASALQELCTAFSTRTALENERDTPATPTLKHKKSSTKSAKQVAVADARSKSFFQTLNRLDELIELRQAVANLHDAFTSNTLEVVRQAQALKSKENRRIPRKAVPPLTNIGRSDVFLDSVARLEATSPVINRFRMSLASDLCPFPTIAGLHTLAVDTESEAVRERLESDAMMKALGVRPFHPCQAAPSPRREDRKSSLEVIGTLPSTRRSFDSASSCDISESQTTGTSDHDESGSSVSHSSSSASSYSQTGTGETSPQSETSLPEVDLGMCGPFSGLSFLKIDPMKAAQHLHATPDSALHYLHHPVSPKTARIKDANGDPWVTFRSDEDDGDGDGRCAQTSVQSEGFRDRLASAPDVFLVDPTKRNIGRITEDMAHLNLSHRKASLQVQTLVGQKPVRPKKHRERSSPNVSPSADKLPEQQFTARLPPVGQVEETVPEEVLQNQSDDQDGQDLIIPVRPAPAAAPIKAATKPPSTVSQCIPATLPPPVPSAKLRSQPGAKPVQVMAPSCEGKVARVGEIWERLHKRELEDATTHAQPTTSHLPTADLPRPHPGHLDFTQRLSTVPYRQPTSKGTRRRPSVIVGGQICDVLTTPTASNTSFQALTPPPPTPMTAREVSYAGETCGDQRNSHAGDDKLSHPPQVEKPAEAAVVSGDAGKAALHAQLKTIAELESPLKTGSEDRSRPAWWKEQAEMVERADKRKEELASIEASMASFE
ncbi:hypothetical protein BCV69DRAFT_299241 [Microstroma glucosiphilum]|uniref:Uncharacterized protein n=1 Tax=Pseudomicrostroma glucosiphilum TaxID=1684307 RepID=A0A316U8Q8_9BASI|nr:hypothetical protein BCV69DRAFT_299241 [Pseudomicrostroma glucosiphilum]PWN20763.1 hypothetical protein BCV69DRAFT_299241 [Pseudomicrostroma glucosiphilum]